MTSATDVERVVELSAERLQRHCVEANKTDVAQRCRELASVIELSLTLALILGFAACCHGRADVDEDSHWNTRLQLEHLEDELVETEIGSPVHGTQVIALIELAMIQEFLTRTPHS